jgi:tetratricopeptide (TPR) repeat protein
LEPLASGALVGPYRLEALLGEGGMGSVYRAVDTRLDRPVAIKVCAERFNDRFEREARSIAALNHPNICTLYDVGANYLVMELVEGRTLSGLRGQTPLSEAWRIGSQVAAAVAAAHSTGIVHRDIKPSNVMLRADGWVKVLDFGLALRTSAELGENTQTAITESGMRVGTLRYMSPEQAKGAATAPATDIFSLGILLYELAAGRHPFEGASQLEVLSAIVSAAPVRPSRFRPEISEAVENLILRMLEKDPRLRPAADEVARTLSAGSGPSAGAVVPPRARRLMVGRDKELGELRAALDAADAGSGQMLCVAGEAGIGKSALLEDFASELRAGECLLASGRCSERLAGSEAYQPLLEALESLLRGGGERMAQIMKSVAPTWYVQIAPVSASDTSEEKILADVQAASQARLKRELVAFLEEAGRARPLALFLDDMHWADDSTVDVISYAGARLSTMRVLILAAYRPSDLLLARHAFLRVRQELQARGVCRELALGFLSAADVQNYLDLEFPGHAFPAELARTIHTNTEGSALFMADLARYLRDRGAVAETEGQWRLVKPLAEIVRELPESVRSMIERKIDRLDEAQRKLAVAAAIQGQEFDSAIVARALSMDAAEAEEGLEALDRLHGLVHLTGEREYPDATLTLRYSFVHVLYQNALEGSLPATRKAALSGATARALLAAYGARSGEVAAQLALLFWTAREYARASDHFLEAARNAARVYGYPEACGLAHRAIEAAEKLQGNDRHSRVPAAALEMGGFYQATARFDEAIAAFEAAEQAGAAAGEPKLQASALSKAAIAHFWSKRVAEAQRCAERARELARLADSNTEIAVSEAVMASARLCMGWVEEAAALFAGAVPILREEQPVLLSMQGFLLTRMARYDEAARALTDASLRAREIGDVFATVHSLFMRALATGNQGRISEALASVAEGWRLAERIDDRYWLPRLGNTRGWLLAEAQDPEAALRSNLEAVELASGFREVESGCNSHINAAHNYTVLGEPARALEHLRQAEQLSATDTWFRWVYGARLHEEFAAYWIAQGDLAQAAQHAAAPAADTNPKRRAWSHKLLGDIAMLEDRCADAARHYDDGLALMRQFPYPTIEWQILKAAADAGGRRGDRSVKDEFRGRARAIVGVLAESIAEDGLRQRLAHLHRDLELH